jgi:hypothetical protein
VKHFVAQDLFEDGARRRIVVDDVSINRKPSGGRLLGDVQKSEERFVGLVFNTQIVDAVIHRRQPAGRRRRRSPRSQQRGAALAEQVSVMQLIYRVREVKTA